MARYAVQVDGNDVVTKRIVIPDTVPLTHRSVQGFCRSIGLTGTWLSSGDRGDDRANLAGPGHVYDRANDRFLPPRPYPSWTLEEDAASARYLKWTPPKQRPPVPDDKQYDWDEGKQEWVERDRIAVRGRRRSP